MEMDLHGESRASVENFVSAKLYAEWPNKVQWAKVRQKLQDMQAHEKKDKSKDDAKALSDTEKVEFKALCHAVRHARIKEKEVEDFDDFFRTIDRLSVHENEVLAVASANLVAVSTAEDERIATERRLTDFFKHTRANVTDIGRHVATEKKDETKLIKCSTHSFPDFNKYKEKKQMLGGNIVDSDPSCELLRALHMQVDNAYERPEFQSMTAATDSFVEETTPALLHKVSMDLAPSKAESHALVDLHVAQKKWFEFTTTRQSELVAEKERIETKLDSLLHIGATPARKKVDPKAPFEAGYNKEARKRRAIEIPETTVQHPAIPRLRTELTRVIAALHIHGHEATILASPYQTMFDYRSAVASHPQMRVATERARIAKTDYSLLKKKKNDAKHALEKRHSELFRKLRKEGKKGFEQDDDFCKKQKDWIVSIARIDAAVGCYDILQVPRGCSRGDVNFMMKTYFVRKFKKGVNDLQSGEHSRVLKKLNEAVQEIFPNHKPLEDDDGNEVPDEKVTPGRHDEKFPLVINVTELQMQQTMAIDTTCHAGHAVLRLALKDMLLPLARSFPRLGLGTGWFPTKAITKIVTEHPAFEIFRRPYLRLVSFDIAPDEKLFSTCLVDETRIRFGLPTVLASVATVKLALPSGLEFEAPFELLTLTVDATTLAFPELAAQMASKAEGVLVSLSDRVVDAILQDVSSHAPHKMKASEAEEEWRRRAHALAVFRSEVSQRTPLFIKDWPRWFDKFIAPPHEQDEKKELSAAPEKTVEPTLLAIK